MLEKPRVTTSAARLTAVVRLTVPRAEIRNVMRPALQEVVAAVTAQGVGPAGPWFTHHLRMDPAVFDVEVCVPVTAPIAPAGRVSPSELAAATVARAIYRGGYDGLEAAWGEFQAWIAAQGHRTRADLWEVYVAGPESGPDPATWRTELNHPLAP
jgi:effector-binding domain-containing protein